MATAEATTRRGKRRRPSARGAARLAAVQALYQHAMAGTPLAPLLHEFHRHRLGVLIDDEAEATELVDADQPFFDDVVGGALARVDELEGRVAAHLATGWSMDRLDRPMRAILLAGAYELIARPDVPAAAVVSEYADIAHAFYEAKEAGFVNALLDRLARDTRPG